MDVYTQSINQPKAALDITSLTLMSTPANQILIRKLYAAGHIQEYAKFLSSRLINKQYTWGFILQTFCQIFGLVLLTVGAIIFFQEKWPLQSVLYQSLTIELMLIFTTWHIAHHHLLKSAGRLFLGLGLLLSIAGITQIFYLQHVACTLTNLLQFGLFFTLPWLILLRGTFRYFLLTMMIFSLTIIGVAHATI